MTPEEAIESQDFEQQQDDLVEKLELPDGWEFQRVIEQTVDESHDVVVLELYGPDGENAVIFSRPEPTDFGVIFEGDDGQWADNLQMDALVSYIEDSLNGLL